MRMCRREFIASGVAFTTGVPCISTAAEKPLVRIGLLSDIHLSETEKTATKKIRSS